MLHQSSHVLFRFGVEDQTFCILNEFCFGFHHNGFSHYITEIKPDLIIVHGDRLEAMAGAIVGSFNNILVAHVEGGEVSGTIDESIRHSVSKMAHIHLVANEEAKKRLIQLGEFENSIYVFGSPDLDLMNPAYLPNLEKVKKYYEIEFEEFSIAIFHPVTTEYKQITENIKQFKASPKTKTCVIERLPYYRRCHYKKYYCKMI